MVGHEDRAREFKNGIERAVKKRNEATNEAQRHNAREELKTVRKEYKQRLRERETEWWDALLVKCEEAMRRQGIGEMYSILKQLGLRGYAVPNSKATVIAAETFKQHFHKMQEKREENELTEKIQSRKIIRAFAKTTPEGRQIAKECSTMLSEEEILKEWAKVKEKAPGEDNIRMICLKSALIEFQKRIVKVMQNMFTTSAEYWDDIVKVGLIIPLHKKGAKDKPDSFRGVCLLSMVSRILARILTTRLRDWS